MFGLNGMPERRPSKRHRHEGDRQARGRPTGTRVSDGHGTRATDGPTPPSRCSNRARALPGGMLIARVYTQSILAVSSIVSWAVGRTRATASTSDARRSTERYRWKRTLCAPPSPSLVANGQEPVNRRSCGPRRTLSHRPPTDALVACRGQRSSWSSRRGSQRYLAANKWPVRDHDEPPKGTVWFCVTWGFWEVGITGQGPGQQTSRKGDEALRRACAAS